MNFNNFVELAEDLRSADLAPRKEKDPKKRAMQQRINKAGNRGMVDTVSTITGKPIKNARDFRKAGKEVASAATGVQFGDEQDPVDRALAMTRGPARYQKEVEAERNRGVKVADREKGVKPGEFEKLPIQKRMDYALGGKPVPSATGEVEDALRDARLAASSLEAPEPITMKGVTKKDKKGNPILDDDGKEQDVKIYGSAGLKHAFQRTGLNIGDRDEDGDYDEDNPISDRTLSDTDLDQIVSGSLDAEKILDPKSGLEISADQLASPGGAERSALQKPSKADLEAIYNRSQEWEKALDKQDAKKIQEMSFTKDVDDDTLNNFIDKLGKTNTGSERIINSIKKGGIGGEREDAVYGGDLGEAGKKYQVKGAPDGVYDLVTMKRENDSLYNKALVNRGREAVRTYLQQAGRDAYAPHEGLRSITDMDLEHIKSLKDPTDESGEKMEPGWDHPSNWVYASPQLNRGRGNQALTKTAKSYDKGDVKYTAQAKDNLKQSYNSLVDRVLGERPKDKDAAAQWDELKAGISDELGGDPSGSNQKKRGIFGDIKRTNSQQQQIMDKLKELGATQEEIDKFSLGPDDFRDADSTNIKTVVGAQDDVKPASVDPEAYDKFVSREHEANFRYNKGIDALKMQYPDKKTEADLLDTKEGRAFMQALDGDNDVPPAAATAAPKPTGPKPYPPKALETAIDGWRKGKQTDLIRKRLAASGIEFMGDEGTALGKIIADRKKEEPKKEEPPKVDLGDIEMDDDDYE
jgi:hypothetical protein